jgi:adenylate cyclase
MPTLTVKQGSKVIKEVVINKPSFSIGRLPENDLELPDNLASRRHTEILKQGTAYTLYDLGSANGTFLNKKKVKSEPLKDGDEIQIGNTIILFKEQSSFNVPVPPKPPPPPKQAKSSFDSDVVKHIGELSLDYRLNVKDIIASGQSIAQAAQATGEKSKESTRFFILYHLGRAVATADTLDEVLEIGMSSVFDVISADRGTIMILDKATGKLIPKLTKRRLSDKEKQDKADGKQIKEPEVYISSTITNKVITDKVSLITSDAAHDPRFQSGLSIAQFNIRSALCVPLWEKEDVFGVIYVDNLMKTHAFTNDDLELLTAIANQVAIRMKQDELNNKLRKEALLRGNLERYHSPDVVEMIIKHSGGKENPLDVRERVVTILFTDIQNFTTLSEKITPIQLAEMLNKFFETVTKIIFEFKGSVNKFIGDAVLATFNAPIDLENHQLNAVKASVKIIQAIQESQKNDPPEAPKYNVRLGVNTGTVVAGNVGAKTRIEYAVLGDVVNIASRLNQYADSNEVAVGESTYECVKNDFQFACVGGVKLKGKAKEVQVYKISITPEDVLTCEPPK